MSHRGGKGGESEKSARARSALRTIFHELRAQLRLHPLGLHKFRETGI